MGNKPQKPAPTLDLHGYAVDEVFDAVEAFLSKNANARLVRIMHGKGTGKVKAKVLEYLKLANYPARPERMENGQVNDGVLVVFME
jgi:dsDNA-specific endonuclease/ATPase MutS2